MAITYLIAVHFHVVIKHGVQWNSDMGTLMLTPPVICIAYAWIMAILSLTGLDKWYSDPQVIQNEGHWKAKDVHFPDKFSL
jgi:hypothetical protein